jgi:cholesterol transport system auxiliary component
MMPDTFSLKSVLKTVAWIALPLLLTGCVNLAGKAPPSLLVLTANKAVASGAQNSGNPSQALVVLIPDVPRKIDTNRVPVQVDASQIAYLKNAFWADKPARLMQQLINETIRAQSNRLVLTEVEAGGNAERMLSGNLMEFGIDASRMEAVVIFEAVKMVRGKPLQTKRFERRASLTAILPAPAGAALNQAANEVAADIASWME